MKVRPYSYFWWCRYFCCPWVSLVTTDEFSARVTKITSKIRVSWTDSLLFCFRLILTQWIMAALSKGCKPDNFDSSNSLNLSFTNIWGLRSSFVDRESFLESFLENSPDILTLCETKLDDPIDSGSFSVRAYLPLIRKDSTSHMHSLAVYVKERLPFAQDLSLENSLDSYLRFLRALLYAVPYFFFLCRSPSSLLYTVYHSISFNID